MKRIIIAVLIAFLGTIGVSAETVREVSVQSTADNNIFATSEGTSDYLTEVSTYLASVYKGDGYDTRLFYQGAGYLFADAGDRSFTTQEVGIAHIRQLGSAKNRLYAGASFLTRLDHTDYNVYDYAGMRVFLNGKFYAAPKTMIRLGYHLATRNYWNLDTAGYADHYVFGQVTQFLPSKTTLRGDLSYSYKTHFSDEGQMVIGGQVAQSLRPGTGFSLRYQRRVNTISPSTDLSLNGFSLDEDILVDRYDYSGNQVTARLTQQLPLRSTLMFSGGYESQTYDNQVALTADGLPVSDLAIRLDKITFGEVSLDVPVANRLDLGVNYRIEKSLSNDMFYDYDGRHALSLDFGLRF
jgi:hypothetical protein